MTVDPTVVPGLLLLAAELLALAAVGFVVARVALRQSDDRMALAQGLAVGPALWGLTVNFLLHVLPGLAGAIAGWVIFLAIGAGLVWRRSAARRLSPRTVAGFSLAALALFWIGLASRQLLSLTDPEIHLGLSATIRAGSWPPALPWNPGQPAPYHYGTDLLVGLLTPPFGLDLAFTTELLGAYCWTGFVLIVATTILRFGGWPSAIVLTPLLLTAGAWTMIPYVEPPGILLTSVPAGIPAPGIRASLTDIYWPGIDSAALPWLWPVEAAPPNIWKPQFILSYALLFTVLERSAASRERSWPAALTLAALIGFTGLMEETAALITMALWAILETLHLAQSKRQGVIYRGLIVRAAAGPALAAVLLAVGGGVLPSLLGGRRGARVSSRVDQRRGEPPSVGVVRVVAGRRRAPGGRSFDRGRARPAAGLAPSPGPGAGDGEPRVPASRVRTAIRTGARCSPVGRARPQSGVAGLAPGRERSGRGAASPLAPRCGRAFLRADYLANHGVTHRKAGAGPQPRAAIRQRPARAAVPLELHEPLHNRDLRVRSDRRLDPPAHRH